MSCRVYAAQHRQTCNMKNCQHTKWNFRENDDDDDDDATQTASEYYYEV